VECVGGVGLAALTGRADPGRADSFGREIYLLATSPRDMTAVQLTPFQKRYVNEAFR
jgi:hypothetical protein